MVESSGEYDVAPTAVIETGAQIGTGCVIWRLSQIRSGAVIGEGTSIGRNVFVDSDVVIGRLCRIQNDALIYSPSQLGDGIFVGPGAILTNDANPRAVNPDFSPKGTPDWEKNGVTVGDGASLGAGVIVVAGTRIGQWALAAAGAVVVASVPAHALVAGNPARQVGWVGRAGHRLEPIGIDGRLRCPSTGAEYLLEGSEIRQAL